MNRIAILRPCSDSAFRVGRAGSRFLTSVLAVVVLAVAGTPQNASADIFDWFRGAGDDAVPPTAPKPDGTAPAETGPGGLLGQKEKAFLEFVNQPPLDLPIRVTKSEWSEADEAGFGNFIAHLGRAVSQRKCNTVKSCMRNPEANIFAQKDPSSLMMFSDCGKFPYVLRAYYAYENNLPFAYVTEVSMNMQPYASLNNKDAELKTKKMDASPYGNQIQTRGGSNVASAPTRQKQLLKYLDNLMQLVSTRTLRVGPLTPNYDNSDLYPVAMNRTGIGAGTIVHSTGHALVVWNVDGAGTIRAIDAHPDGSIQFKDVQPATLDRSRPDQGLGFFRFRPLKLVGAQVGEGGQLFGGQIVQAKNAELFAQGKFSLEQWFGPDSNVNPDSKVDPISWTHAFRKIGFWDYLTQKMRDTKVVVQADEAVQAKLQDLCTQIQQRVPDVATGNAHGIPAKPHPTEIPADIFGEEDPDWGSYSLPGRDGRIRASVAELLKSAVTNFRLAKQGSPNVKFEKSAADYVTSLRARVAAVNNSCSITYVNSKGGPVTLTFNQVLKRLARMSFDPYHCPEKAWGASGAELQTCLDTDGGNAWYNAEAPMRNTAGKLNANGDNVIRSTEPITIQMLRTPSLIDQPDDSPTNLGTLTPPITDLDANLASPKFIEILTK